MKTVLAGIALTLAIAAPVASAGQLDKLMGGSSSSSLTSGSMGNVAGILQYCVTNNYLGGDSGASGVKDQLLGKLGGGSSATAAAPTQDKGYLDGAKGLLKSKDGKTVDLGGAASSDSSPMGDMKAKVTKKACDVVLKQGKGMLGGMGK
ncbi:hypothetical protein BJI69_09000 [Luteibacter rhizovicinus DSM 16549]|uniref:Uncharacterized protein n=1 Tax=Luteibacter rhizovicinus DSM 16549 TaxID=1440763 RepID=A0A0G9HA54_9GAMM|nr:DUF2501 domain-containing protein [Luteibacter rhizovicinus]APG04018.1 hypothetical protein BJI69_09000 [Luteibacter rhizovicinus DSM 16549]KLD66503.1 hypothetical protein Y883_13780 [Luteibacter rhizovicinus DSM 16549]KLD75363.1 hypothetical protein Y886_27420 [Xanthomonas hyacinthi DSM 19077]